MRALQEADRVLHAMQEAGESPDHAVGKTEQRSLESEANPSEGRQSFAATV